MGDGWNPLIVSKMPSAESGLISGRGFRRAAALCGGRGHARHVSWFVGAAKTRRWANNEPAHTTPGDDTQATAVLVNYRNCKPSRALLSVESSLTTRSGLVSDVVLLPVSQSVADACALRDGFATNVQTLAVRTRGVGRNVDSRPLVTKERYQLRLCISTSRLSDRLSAGTGSGTCFELKERRSILSNGFEPDWLSMALSICRW